ncbi:MAG: TonB-dependent receptor [Bacteroidia bacterium]|nr:TonB-dependent receptor [Bacteroidia bacterium]
MNCWAQASTISTDTIWIIPEVAIVGRKEKSLPGSAQIITKEKLSYLNQPDINKVLRTVPGVNIRDEEGWGLRPNIGLRGTPVNRSAKITLMEDGILIAPAPYSDPAAYYFPSLSRMEAVEVLKGSSQIKYGPYTIGGAINLISTSFPTNFKGFGLFSYGSFGTNQQRIWIGDTKENIDYVFELNRWASNGFKQLDGGGNTGFDRRDFMAKLRIHSQKETKVFQSLALKFLNSTEEANESYLGLTYADFKANPNRRYAATQKDLLDMKHYHTSLNHTIIPFKNFSLSTTGYFAKTFREWARVNSIKGLSLNTILANSTSNDSAYQIMTGQMNGSLTYQSAARSYTVRGIQLQAQYELQTSAIRHQWQVGMRYHEDFADRWATQSMYTMTNGKMTLTNAGIKGNQENQIRSAKSWATFFQYSLHYKNLTITPGIRWEKIDLRLKNYGNTDNARIGTFLKEATNALAVVLPGVGINYTINSQMSIFGGLHKGFSPPGTPSLNTEKQAKVETALNYELGYRYFHEVVIAQFCLFLSNYDNILGSDQISAGGMGTGNMFNAGKAKAQGIEINIEYDIIQSIYKKSIVKLPISLIYTYTDAYFQQAFRSMGGDWGTQIIQKNDKIPFITPHQLTLVTSLQTTQFNVTLVSRFIGETRTTPGQNVTITPRNNVKYTDVNAIASYWVVDLSANYKFYRHFTIFMLINNLFNATYIVANLPQGYRPGIPFAFNLGAKFEF